MLIKYTIWQFNQCNSNLHRTEFFSISLKQSPSTPSLPFKSHLPISKNLTAHTNTMARRPGSSNMCSRLPCISPSPDRLTPAPAPLPPCTDQSQLPLTQRRAAPAPRRLIHRKLATKHHISRAPSLSLLLLSPAQEGPVVVLGAVHRPSTKIHSGQPAPPRPVRGGHP